jgi:TetR/AcrR family fatty acid metabolism transcriptional regulator
MPRKSINRQEQAQQTRNRIYTAAIDLLDRKGFDRMTVAEISKRANVSVGAFYHYFQSKNDILAEIFRLADEYFVQNVADSLTAPTIPEQIVEYFDHYARFNISTGVDTVQQLFNPTIKFFAKEGRPMQTILAALIREGQERGELRADIDPEATVRYLFVLARGVVFEWGLRDGDYDIEHWMHEYIQRAVATLTP